MRVTFWRSFRALVWRNAIYRKRRWISSLLELALPIFTIGILILLKRIGGTKVGTAQSVDAPILPGDNETIIPLSFTDYVTALQATRQCERNIGNIRYFTLFGITGIEGDWSVPFVHCDSRQCLRVGQDAQSFCEYRKLALAPRNEATERFKEWILSKHIALNNLENELPFEFNFVEIFETEASLESYVKSPTYGNAQNAKIGGAIVIHSDFPSYHYSIRVNSTNFNKPEEARRPASSTTPSTSRILETYAKTPDDVCTPEMVTSYLGKWNNYCTGQYIYNGAITLQRLIDDWIIFDSGAEGVNKTGNKVAENGVRFATFPRWDHADDGFAYIAEFVPLLVCLGLMYPVSSMIRFIVQEKELKQRELMQMMSVPISAIEWSWFVSLLLFYFPSSLLVTATSTQLFSNSNFFMLFIFWIFVFLSSIVFAIVIASFMSKTSRATMIGVMIYFVGYFASVFFDYTTLNSSIIALLSLHPVVAFGFGLQVIGALEDDKVGIIKATFSFSDNSSGYSFATSLGHLVMDIFVWGILSLYLNRVVQGEYGRANPLHFPFTKKFWFPNLVNDSHPRKKEIGSYEGVTIEPVSDALREQEKHGKSIELYNLTRKFGQKTAVDNLTLSMYSGQITALLGHNGAGKTTTISMLTGMLAPTEGHALVCGKDIQTQMPTIRENLGICLQHDCLFPLLTVREHIEFFFQIKGGYSSVSKDEANASILASIEDVALMEKKNTLSKNLSGGMKRKLSVAIAFCGNSKVVFLDEPTSGMDPFSRRFTWDVIRRYKENRCIVLTTHFMDEADLLGDRIAIMSEGSLRCAASSLFLKKAFGVGYQLTIEKNSWSRKNLSASSLKSKTDDSVDMQSDTNLLNIILKNVVEAKLLSNVGVEMIFQLPLNFGSNSNNVFSELDKQIDDKKIVTYGLSITTLDEVFLMVARGQVQIDSKSIVATNIDESEQSESSKHIEVEEGIDLRSSNETPDFQLNNSISFSENKHFTRHVNALFMKRAKNFTRDKRAWFCSTLLPSFVTLIGFVAIIIFKPERQMKPLSLTLEDFNIDVKDQTIRNPIMYNSGPSFDCNPGKCIMDRTIFDVEGTGESYSYCGSSANIVKIWEGFRGNEECILGNEIDYLKTIEDNGVVLVDDTESKSMFEVSKSIFETSSSFFESTIYGALYFYRDMNTTVNNNFVYYNELANDACQTNPSDYRTKEECRNFEGISYVVVTNFTAPHAALLYQALADEAIINDAVDYDISISATIHPLPHTTLEDGFTAAEDSLLAWFVLIFSFPFVTGTFATFIVAERASKSKHLQKVAGVSSHAYWISSFLWDLMNYQLPLWIVFSLLYIVDVDVFITTERGMVGGTIVSMILFGPAAIGFTYCMTFLFDSPSACNFAVICSNFFVGLAGPLISYVLRIIAVRDFNSVYSDAANILEWCLRFIPSFCLSKALFFAINIDVFELIEGRKLSVWSPPIMLYDAILLAVQGIIYINLAILLDKWSTDPSMMKKWNKAVDVVTCKRLINYQKETIAPEFDTKAVVKEVKDEDVAIEEERIHSSNADDDIIILKDLTKIYGNGKLAVDQISLGISPGECFGLLGINGAGKTTTMSILTTEFLPSSGDAILAGYSLMSSPDQIRQCVGYCPQFDAHFMNLTGQEHVELYASIKGVPKQFVREVALAKLKEVGLSEYDGNRLASVYSGGMKRKLSVACATIGQPRIIFLDEPSTGMDPVARRDLWQVISNMVAKTDPEGNPITSMILTTHSMEECEALCPRIGIMAGGKLRCLGSAQHLKSRFGKGFQVEMKVAEVVSDDEDYRSTVENLVENANSIFAQKNHVETITESSALNLTDTLSVVKSLTNGESISSRITAKDPTGYVIHKNAISEVGVTIEDLGAFCVTEIRINTLIEFIMNIYPGASLRERQHNKVRFEIRSEGLRISSLFNLVEENRESLRLTDYGISQTSLEQVFNMHAAEAEKAKEGQIQ